MQPIKISQNVTSHIWQWAEDNYEHHYARMSGDPKVRIRSLFYGKMGEQAVGQCLSVPVDFSQGTDKGFDLIYHSKKLAIKTKGAKTKPYNLSTWFCHIPCDQYNKLIEVCDYLVACALLYNCNFVYIIGYLPIEAVMQKAVLHRAGDIISPGFKLPHPDSYGINSLLFQDINHLKANTGGKLNAHQESNGITPSSATRQDTPGN